MNFLRSHPTARGAQQDAEAPPLRSRTPAAWAVWTLALVLASTAFLEMRSARAEDPESPPPVKPPAPAGQLAPSPEEAARIRALVLELGADDFATRERASRELARIGEAARPALEEAARSSESSETQWRARQILRRLSGQTARPLGGEPAEEPESPRNPLAPFLGEDAQELHKRIAELMERMGQGAPGLPGGMESPFGRQAYEVEGLRLLKRLGMVMLEVDDTDDPTGRPQRYRGWSLEHILRQHPELARHPRMQALKDKVASEDPMARLEALMQRRGALPPMGGSPGTSMHVQMNGVSIQQGPDGAKVTLREQDENGRPVQKVYEGKTLEEIKQKHPEVAKRLGKSGFSFELIGPSVDPRRIFGSPFARRSRPAPFGVRTSNVGDTLAYHLELTRGHGALVRHVFPGSAAEALGLERSDIVLAIGDEPVTDWRRLDRQLRQRWDDRATPLTVEIIRRGKRKTLSRPEGQVVDPEDK